MSHESLSRQTSNASFKQDPEESTHDTPESGSLLSDSDGEERALSLSDRISNSLLKSAFDGRDFLPEGFIDEHVTSDAVWEELDCPSKYRTEGRQILDFMFDTSGLGNGGARKLFVIILLIGLPKEGAKLVKAMYRFLRTGTCDSALPIETDGNPAFYNSSGGIHSYWTGMMIRMFKEKQWAVLAPVITRHNPKLILEPDHILPVVYKSQGGGSGAFGDVVQVTLHENHYLEPILKVGAKTRDLGRALLTTAPVQRRKS